MSDRTAEVRKPPLLAALVALTALLAAGAIGALARVGAEATTGRPEVDVARLPGS